jgi:hypothetical protein
MQNISGKDIYIGNRDGIDLRHGCKNFRIDNISGVTGDDFIALSTLGLHSENPGGGSINSMMVTTRAWQGTGDDTEQITITNIVCESSTRAIAIRANDVAGINHVYVNGLTCRGGYNAMLVGGKGYGHDSQPGKINNIHALNIIGGGRHSLIQIEEAISECSFNNCTYTGDGDEVILYKKIDKSETRKIIATNLVKIGKSRIR